MAIDTPVDEFEYPGEEQVGSPPPPTPVWRRSAWLQPEPAAGPSSGRSSATSSATGSATSSPAATRRSRAAARTTWPSCSGSRSGVAGWLAGIGALNYPLAKIVGLRAAASGARAELGALLPLTDDHKVVGMQYAVGCPALPVHRRPAGHGSSGPSCSARPTTCSDPGPTSPSSASTAPIMMMMASSAIVGPLGNWLVPLMIGSRRMAFPRVEAFSFWIFMAGYLVILSALFFGGFPTGWTGYAPLQTQADGRDGLVPGRLRRDRHRHDPGRLQPGASPSSTTAPRA